MIDKPPQRRSFAAVLSIAMCACVAGCNSSRQTSLPVQTGPGGTSSAATRLQSLAGICANPAPARDAALAKSDPRLFAWGLFLYINCPSQPGPSQPVDWETWKPNYAVYLPGGKPPAAWGTLTPRVLLAQPEIDGSTLLDKNGQPVLNEIRMNKASFEYIVQRKLYSKAAQLAFFSDPSSPLVAFPPDSLEIKASWLILTAGDPGNARYYTVQSSYMDSGGQTHQVLAGLTGLHIASKVLPTWFWTTFEQLDNQLRTRAPATALIPPDVQQLNDDVHAALPATSVWRNYNLRGAMTTFTNPDGSAAILSNTQLETNFQKSSSCITCHSLATRGSAPEGRLGFFETTRTGVQGYIGATGDPSNKYFDAFQKPVCYDANRSVFTDCKTPNPEVIYKTLDFVWSLREAK
jgi:hypothetical protein